MSAPVILAAWRSIVAPRGGVLAGFETHALAAPVIRACLASAGVAPEAVDELVLSNALGAGGNPARLAALAAGLPERVAGLSIDRQCAGGLDALRIGAALIAAGAGLVIAGGAESYSRRPLRARSVPGGPAVPYDRPPFTPFADRDPEMAAAAAALAERLGLDRAAQDDWAVRSHARALAAADRLAAECVALPGVQAAVDPFARRLTARLAARAPVLAGTVSHGNTAPAADGAAFVLLASPQLAARLGRAGPRLLASATLGAAPDEPGLSPLPAIAAVLGATGLGPRDLAQVELMEAFAAQALACIEGAGLDPARVNPAGGALARGHPIGASGAVLAVRLARDLGPGQRGLAAIAAAGGIGTAAVIEG